MQVPFTTRMVKAGAMALKAVVPGIPKAVKDRELLEEDLHRIGCHGFLGKPWGLRMEDLVAELLGGKDNRWEPSTGEVDREGMEESLRFRKRRRRYGIPDRPVYRWYVFW